MLTHKSHYIYHECKGDKLDINAPIQPDATDSLSLTVQDILKKKQPTGYLPILKQSWIPHVLKLSILFCLVS